MLSIRLSKNGKKNRPAYRIVVANKRSGRDGRPLEILGYFDPYQKEIQQLNKTRLEHWQRAGAHLSAAVDNILGSKYKFKAYAGSRTGAKES